jgi:hypothetical protein
MKVVPAALPVAVPAASIVATAGTLDCHATVKLRDEPSS